MYNLLISAGAAVGLLLLLVFTTTLPWWSALLLAMVLFAGLFYLITRSVMKKVMAVMETANRDLQAQRVDKAVSVLKSAFPYGKWQVYVTGQLNAQIGIILYVKRDFSAAFPYLEKAFVRNWVAVGMLAVSYMKRNKKEKMLATFERGVQWNAKEPLLWNLYAWCLCEGGDTGKAKEVLGRALKKLPGDERLSGNLQALNEGKKMKMKGYGDMWLQFHLEKQSAILKQHAAAMGGMARRRIVRR